MLSKRIRVKDCGFLDAPLRLGISAAAICDPATLELPDDEQIAALSREMRRVPRNSLAVAPMGLGGHVDHIGVRNAAIRTLPPAALAFYEDLPYVTWTPANLLQKTVAEIEGEARMRLKPVVVRSPHAIWRKRGIVRRYESQITPEEAGAIARWSAEYGGGERIWIPRFGPWTSLLS